MRHFVRGWYAHSEAYDSLFYDEAMRRADALIERLEALPNLRELGAMPLLLTIITILHYYEGKLPEDRADLYEDIVQLLLTRWTLQRRDVGRREAGPGASLLERLKADGNLGGLKDYHLRGVLEELAFRAHRSEPSTDGRGLLERDVVRGALIKLFEDFGLPTGRAAEKAMDMLVYLEEESGLLQHEGDGSYALPHLTYEEYMAGCYLAKRRGWVDFCSVAYNLWRTNPVRWREVILLSLGRMVRGDDRDLVALWLHFLVERVHGERQRLESERTPAALFAAECLADLGGKPALIGANALALPDLWESMAWALAEALESEALTESERVSVGTYLGMIGDPRPGVCDLDPESLTARFDGGPFVIGNTQAEIEGELKHQPDAATAKEFGDWLSDTLNEQELVMPAFELGRYPVTNAQYALFIHEGGYDLAQPWWQEVRDAWLAKNDRFRWSKEQPEFWLDARFGRDCPNYPVVGVSWYEAYAFCRWLTLSESHNPKGFVYRLPSEAEWEYAARGAPRRRYPWVSELPGTERVNYDQRHRGTTAVGCFSPGATPEGVYDLAGNVWEWTGSIYGPYPPRMAPDPLPDAEETVYYTVRGGSWREHAVTLNASCRFYFPPHSFYDYLGFRLARALKQ